MMRRTLAATGLLALALLSAGCPWEQTKTSDVDIQTIQTNELQTYLAGSKGRAVLVDVRPAAKFQKEHLPEAVNIPLPELAEGEPRLAEAKHIVVYGSGWTDVLSRAAAKRLMALGYKNVYDYRGGVELWKNEGGKVLGTAATQPATTP